MRKLGKFVVGLSMAAIMSMGLAACTPEHHERDKNNNLIEAPEPSKPDPVPEVPEYKPDPLPEVDPTPDDEGELVDHKFEFEAAEYKGVSSNNGNNFGHACANKSYFFDSSLSGGICVRNISPKSGDAATASNAFSFKFTSDKAVKAQMRVSVASRYDNGKWVETRFDEMYTTTVNGKVVENNCIVPAATEAEKLQGNNYACMKVIQIEVSLKKGENEIVFSSLAKACNVDYINIRTSATIGGWTDHYDIWSADVDNVVNVTKDPTLETEGQLVFVCKDETHNAAPTTFTLPALSSPFYTKVSDDGKTVYSFTLAGKTFEFVYRKSIDVKVTDAAVSADEESGKVYYALSGTYNAANFEDYGDEELYKSEILKIYFGLKGGEGVTQYTTENISLDKESHTFTVKYDISELPHGVYDAYYRSEQSVLALGIKQTQELIVGDDMYTLTFGGTARLEISDARSISVEATDAEIVEKDGKILYVVTGKVEQERCTPEYIQQVVESNKLILEGNDKHDNLSDDQAASYTAKIVEGGYTYSASTGVYTVAYDLTDLPKGAYNVRYGAEETPAYLAITKDTAEKQLEVDGENVTYTLFNYSGEQSGITAENKDSLGLLIVGETSFSSLVTGVEVANKDGVTTITLNGRYSSYGYEDEYITNRLSNNVFNLKNGETVIELLDTADVNVNLANRTFVSVFTLPEDLAYGSYELYYKTATARLSLPAGEAKVLFIDTYKKLTIGMGAAATLEYVDAHRLDYAIGGAELSETEDKVYVTLSGSYEAEFYTDDEIVEKLAEIKLNLGENGLDGTVVLGEDGTYTVTYEITSVALNNYALTYGGKALNLEAVDDSLILNHVKYNLVLSEDGSNLRIVDAKAIYFGANSAVVPELKVEDGKAYFYLHGTYTQEAENYEAEHIQAIVDRYLDVQFIGGSWPRTRLTTTAENVTLGTPDENGVITYVAVYDLSGLAVGRYCTHYGASDSDLKPVDNYDKSEKVGYLNYQMVVLAGQSGETNYFGCVGLNITDLRKAVINSATIATPEVKLENRGGKAMIVISGGTYDATVELYTAEEAKPLLEAAIKALYYFDLQNNPNEGGDSGYATLVTNTHIVNLLADNKFEVVIDITDLKLTTMTMHFVHANADGTFPTGGGTDFKPNIDTFSHSLVIGYNTYEVIYDKEHYYKCVGVKISSPKELKVNTTISLEASADKTKLYYVINGTYDNYEDSEINAAVIKALGAMDSTNANTWDVSDFKWENPVITAADGKWTAKFDITAHSMGEYLVHYAGGGSDLFAESGIAEIIVGKKKYSYKNHNFGNWQRYVLTIEDATEMKDVAASLLQEDGKIYVVVNGTYKTYTYDEMAKNLENVVADYMYHTILGNDAEKTVTLTKGESLIVTITPDAEGSLNGSYQVELDVTDATIGTAFFHYSYSGDVTGNNFKCAITADGTKYIENEGLSYELVTTSGASQSWANGLLGLKIVDSTAPAYEKNATVSLTKENNKAVYTVHGSLTYKNFEDDDAILAHLTAYDETAHTSGYLAQTGLTALTKEGLEEAIAKLSADFQQNPYAVYGNWDHDEWAPTNLVEKLIGVTVTLTKDEAKNSVTISYDAKYDVTDLGVYKYTAHYGVAWKQDDKGNWSFGVADTKPNTAYTSEVITIGDTTYQLIVDPSDKGDANKYWGCPGLIVANYEYSVAQVNNDASGAAAYGKWSFYKQGSSSATIGTHTYSGGKVTVEFKGCTNNKAGDNTNRIYYMPEQDLVGKTVKISFNASMSVSGSLQASNAASGTTELSAGEVKQVEYTYTVDASKALRLCPIVAAGSDVIVTITDIVIEVVQ